MWPGLERFNAPTGRKGGNRRRAGKVRVLKIVDGRMTQVSARSVNTKSMKSTNEKVVDVYATVNETVSKEGGVVAQLAPAVEARSVSHGSVSWKKQREALRKARGW